MTSLDRHEMKTNRPSSYFDFLRRQRRENRSQSLAEFAMILPIFLTLMCGVFDYGWMIGNANIMAMASREAAMTTQRQTTDPVVRGLEAAVDSARPRLNLTSEFGGVVITRLAYVPATYTNQVIVSGTVPNNPNAVTNNCLSTGAIYGGGDFLKNKSRILGGGTNGTWTSIFRNPPFDADNIADGQVMVCAEIFYTNQFVTPIGTLIGLVTPPQLYEVGYF